jgi:hypothetical protein
MMKKFYVAGEEILTEKDRGMIIKNKVNGVLYNENIYNFFLTAVLDLKPIEVSFMTGEEREEIFKKFRKYCIGQAIAEFNEDYCVIDLDCIPEDIEYFYYNIFNTTEFIFDKDEQIETIVNDLDTDEVFEEWINANYTAYELFKKEFIEDEINKEFYDSIYQEAEAIFNKTYAKIDLTKLRVF